MSLLSRTLYVPVAAVRPYLALKCTLVLLAFDVWIARLYKGHGHGAGGFNVAHFELLDAVQPSISAPLFVGVIILTGALCLTIAIASRPPRWLIGLAFVLHTWSWAMSMLDSYQHHYLLSIVLLALVFFPRLTAEDALLPPSSPKKRDAPSTAAERRKGKKKKRKKSADEPAAQPSMLSPASLTSAGGYAFLAASIAVVYAYTALSKTDPEWLSGAALKSVLHLQENGMPAPGREDPIGFFRDLAASFGLAGETFWWFMGHSVVGVQLVCALGYLLAPFRDVTRAKWMAGLGWLALFTALSFHVGAEYMDLKIGWFSWYMIGYALIFFLPGRWLVVAARGLVPLVGTSLGPQVIAARILVALVALVVGFAVLPVIGWLGVGLLLLTPLRLLAKAAWTREAEAQAEQTHHVALGAAGLGAAILVGAGYVADLPGAPAAVIAGAVLLGGGVIGLLVSKGHARAIHGYGVGAAVAGLALVASMSLSEARWDFYRNYGGNHRRLGEWAVAYHAYQKAVRYAPDDEAAESRQRRADEMRANIERDGPRRP